MDNNGIDKITAEAYNFKPDDFNIIKDDYRYNSYLKNKKNRHTWIWESLINKVNSLNSRINKLKIEHLNREELFKTVNKLSLLGILVYNCGDMNFWICGNELNIVTLDDKFYDITISHRFKNLQELKEIYIKDLESKTTTNIHHLFSECLKLEKVIIENIKFKRVEKFEFNFEDCENLRTVEFRNLQLGNVVSLNGCFMGCKELKEIDLTWLPNKATRANGIFAGCENLKHVAFKEDTFRNCIRLENAFSRCSSLEEIDFSNMKLDKLKCASGLFSDCKNLKKVLLPKSMKQLNDLSYAFENCSSLEQIDLSDMNLGNLNFLNYIFKDCVNLEEVNFNNSNLKDLYKMDNMFYNCINLKKIGFNNVEFYHIWTMTYMFKGCKSLDSLDLSFIDTSSLMVGGVYRIFEDTKLTVENTGLKIKKDSVKGTK